MQEGVVFVSSSGLTKLKEELRTLKEVKLKEVAQRIEYAKELGDLKENAEYHDAKDEMGMLMGRVRQLEDQIARSRIVEKTGGGLVEIGSNVKIFGGNKEKELTIVGAPEANPGQGLISNESPLGRALIGKKVGDVVTVNLPVGEVDYEIRKID